MTIMPAPAAWMRRHPMVVDGTVAVAVFGLGVLSVRVFFDIGAANPHNFRFATAVACMALLTLPLVFRRRLAPVTLICVTVAIVGYTVFGITEGAIAATAAFVAIYSVGANCQPRVANWARAACISILFGTLMWAVLFRELDIGHSKASIVGAALLSVGSNLFFFIAAWVIGDVARAARLRAAELSVRHAELQQAQEVIAEQAVLDERVRIAREVHDVVAHHVSVMGVQAGAARRVMARSPEQAAEVLSGIEASSRQAVVELQRLLGFLRRDSSDSRDSRDSRAEPSGAVAAPQPRLSGLDSMIEQLNDAGLVASARVTGSPQPLPASVDLSAYRVIQEALTNALKHSGVGTIATVSLSYRPDLLELSVVDDGRGRSNGRTELSVARARPPGRGGHGLVGMRERVALHGGQFEAGLGRGSGFEVKATFPLAGPVRSSGTVSEVLAPDSAVVVEDVGMADGRLRDSPVPGGP